MLQGNSKAMKMIWLGLYIGEIIEIQALQALLQNAIKNKNQIQRSALSDAIFKKSLASNDYFYFVKSVGHMLYAFESTTALTEMAGTA